MSHGFLEILRYFLLALLWLFFLHAARMVLVEVRRSRAERAAATHPVMTPRPQVEREVERLHPFSLRVVEPPGARGRVFEFGEETTIGRAPSCGIPLEGDTFASTLHSRVFQRDGELWLEDLGSRNGTFVNNRRVSAPARLKRGDRIRVGGTLFEVAR